MRELAESERTTGVEPTIVVVDLESIDHETAPGFKAQVESFLSDAWTTPSRLVIDLARVRTMDVNAIAVLIRARARLVPWGGQLEIRNACPVVRRAIEAIGLTERLGLAGPSADDAQ